MPVADATIAGVGGHTLAHTGADGRFAIERGAADRASHVFLRVSHADFDVAREWARWGSDGMRLVLPARVPIEVRVVDEHGAAVHCTGAGCVLIRAVSPDTIAELAPDGDVLRGAACRGRNSLTIELDDGAAVAHEEIKWRPIDVAGSGPVQFRFVATTMQPRDVQVVAPDGTPVADARVEFVDPRGGTVAANQRPVDPAYPTGPARVGTATCDSTGKAHLLGPVGRSLAVRASCDGFAPGLVADVRVPGPDPVVVRLGRGACGGGRVLADPHLRQRIAAGQVALQLQQVGGDQWWPEASKDGLPIESDGSFTFRGAPPGAWKVRLLQPCEQRGKVALLVEDCGVSLTLSDGDNPPVVVDLSAWRWTEATLRVDVDGAVAPGATVVCRRADDPGMDCAVAQCDEAGRCSLLLRYGSYLVRAGNAGGVLSVTGDRIDRELHLTSGEMVVTLVDTKGNPLRGLGCTALPTNEIDRWSPWVLADGDGVLQQRCPAGEWAVLVSSPTLEAADATIDRSRDDVSLQLARARRLLGKVTVRAGETAKATFVVPDDVPR